MMIILLIKQYSKISICFLMINLLFLNECSGEYNLATKEQEYLLFDTAKEVRLGHSLAQKIEREYKTCKDVKLQGRIERIGRNLASVCDRKDITYFFTVLDCEKVNAFSLPGGYVYVNKGLVEKTESDDEIAGVLGHEIGHIVARHSIKRLQAQLGYSLISILALATTKNLNSKGEADLAFSLIMLGYSREDEFLADQLAVKYVKKAGYAPEAIISFLEKLKQIEKETALQPLVASYARTHPYLPERIAATKQEIFGKMDFNDYINKAERENE